MLILWHDITDKTIKTRWTDTWLTQVLTDISDPLAQHCQPHQTTPQTALATRGNRIYQKLENSSGISYKDNNFNLNFTNMKCTQITPEWWAAHWYRCGKTFQTSIGRSDRAGLVDTHRPVITSANWTVVSPGAGLPHNLGHNITYCLNLPVLLSSLQITSSAISQTRMIQIVMPYHIYLTGIQCTITGWLYTWYI